MNMFEQQVGQQLVQQQVLLAEAARLGIQANDDDVREYLQTGPAGEVLFPGRQVHRRPAVCTTDLEPAQISVTDFEDERARRTSSSGACSP